MTQEMCTYVHSIASRVGRAQDSLVLAQIALHADLHGEAVLAWEELARHTHCSRATLARSLQRLESAQWISRRMWLTGTSKRATVFALAQSILDGSQRMTANQQTLDEDKDVRREIVSDGMSEETFASLLRAAHAHGWQSYAGKQLSSVVTLQAPVRLGWLLSRVDGEGELISLTWDTILDHAPSIIEADTPWAMIATIIRNQLNHEHARPETTVSADWEAWDVLQEVAISDYEHGISSVSLRETLSDEDGLLGSAHLVNALVAKGVSLGIASSGTRRMMEIAATSSTSRAITMARSDSLIAALGISPSAAGAWMSLIVGTRRQGMQASYVLRASQGETVPTSADTARLNTIAKHLQTKKNHA